MSSSIFERPARELSDVARERGARAHALGLVREDNPFRVIDRARRGWDAGWCDAEQKTDHKENAA